MLGSHEEARATVRHVSEIFNSEDVNRENRFLITPQQYLGAEKLAGEYNLSLVGFYHSHPDRSSSPSQFDLEHALPWFVYVILPVMGGMSGEMTAWRLHESRMRFDEVGVQIER